MLDRRKFDVSAEAFLMRVLKTTAEPALMFCASPVEREGFRPLYRIDYCVGSKSAPTVIGAGTIIPNQSFIYECMAIGQTGRATESWVAGKPLAIECVGIPGFPGTSFPRIAGIVRFRIQDAEQDDVYLVQGNVLAPGGSGPKVICQLVNDLARIWGGGVARASAKKYPAAQQQFSQWIAKIPRRERLGRVHFASAGGGLTIASLVAQEGYGASPAPRIRYAHLGRAFSAVAEFAIDHKATVHTPRIGAGQSGGTWDIVEQIIRDTLTAQGVRVTVYDLPPKRQTAGAELLI
jgi:O-acetyl-ADP-ribose deacetylase (regulator of RNase III)